MRPLLGLPRKVREDGMVLLVVDLSRAAMEDIKASVGTGLNRVATAGRKGVTDLRGDTVLLKAAMALPDTALLKAVMAVPNTVLQLKHTALLPSQSSSSKLRRRRAALILSWPEALALLEVLS